MANGVSAKAVIPIEAILLVLAIFIASGRLVPRFLQRQYPTLSDSLLIASICNAIALFATDVMTYQLGGMDEYDASAPEPPVSRVIALKKMQFIGNYFYDSGIYIPKLAILALYFRLFPPTMPWLRKALYAASIFTASAMLTTIFLDTFWCGRQVSVNWSPEEGACSTFNSKVAFRIDWGMNILTDVIISMLPFPLLHQLQLNRRQIWGLTATFSLAAVTISVSVVRFTTIEVIQAWTNVFVLSMAEMAAAIMVVSLPSMRASLRRGGFFASKKSYNSSSSRTEHSHRAAASRSGRHGYSNKSQYSARAHTEDESGSEVELNIVKRNDVVYETRRISVHFSNALADDKAVKLDHLS